MSSINVILEGHGGESPDPFLQMLNKETVLKDNGLLLIEDLIFMTIKGNPSVTGSYDARMRVLIQYVAILVRVDWDLVELYEETLLEFLTEEAHELSEEEKKENLRRQRMKKAKRYFLIGLATIGGGAAIGLTGGLAAPFVAAGAGTIIGTAGAAALGSTAGIAIIGSLFGVGGAGLVGYKMKKRVGAVEEFDFEFLTQGTHLHMAIAICGWLTDEEEDRFRRPWLTLRHSREQYCLKWESKYLLELGKAIDYLLSFAVSMAAQEALKYTILSGLITAITWPASLLTLACVIDNPWGVCLNRAVEAGKQLAEMLLTRQQGKRPVTLIGFSLGARVIYYCLVEMCRRRSCEGIIQDVVLLGAPVSGDVSHWKPFSRVVSGRIINGYCSGDWLLKFLYRTSAVQLNIAGLRPIDWNDRRMVNVDLSDIIGGHMDYMKKMDTVLKAVGIRTIDDVIETQMKLKRMGLSSGESSIISSPDAFSENRAIGCLVRRSPNNSSTNLLERGSDSSPRRSASTGYVSGDSVDGRDTPMSHSSDVFETFKDVIPEEGQSPAKFSIIITHPDEDQLPCSEFSQKDLNSFEEKLKIKKD